MRNWIADEIVSGRNTGLISSFGKTFSLSRPTATRIVKQLADENWLSVSGPSRRPVYALGKNRGIYRQYKREVIDENLIWTRDFLPFFELSPNVKNIVQHGFTEIMNNAHDHSNGSQVSAFVEVQGEYLGIAINDDGIGIFEKIASALKLPDRRLALLELSKGKLTTDPERHSGEGIFFTSRMFDAFVIRANGLSFEHFHTGFEDHLRELPAASGSREAGTRVFMLISLASARTTREVFEQFTLDHPDDLSFNKTVVPVRLARLGEESLVSRSQAKRLVARFEGFRKVELDFSDVEEVGQAFADEVFRVFARAHPEVILSAINASDYVQRMIRRVQE